LDRLRWRSRGAKKRIRVGVGAPDKWLYRVGVKRAEDLTLPDFLGIGVPRAGTTWLFNNLRSHPEVFVSAPKELHYFDARFHEPLSSYARNFREGTGRVKGEVTPEYLFVPESRVRFVEAVIPDLKTIVLLRNPVERAWSDALRVKVKRPRRKYEDASEDELTELLTKENFTRRSEYLTGLRTWRQVFSPERMFVGFFEDIRVRPTQLLREIFEHIGVSTDIDWQNFPYEVRVNQNQPVEMPDHIRSLLISQQRSQLEELHDMFGERISAWLT
jgi:hypothetical protein